MTLLLETAPYIPPVTPRISGQDVFDRFEREPDTLAIAVVDERQQPIGIVERNAFLVRMAAQYGYALWSRRPVGLIMKADPLVVDGDVTVEEFCQNVMSDRPSELLHGFIVTCGGRYAGVGSMLGLLQASAAQTAAHAAAAEAASLQAHRALAARGRFLGVMSHEIRTPLNGVLAVAEIIRRRTREPELEPLLDTIVNSGAVLLRLLNDALDLSRAEQSGLELDEEPLSVAALASDSAALWRPQAELGEIALAVDYDGPADLWVLGDAVRLRQVLNNLIGNAMKFAASEVRVALRAAVVDQHASLRAEVSDDGPGIPHDRLNDIFQPFQQTDEGLRRGGAGLGLAVCEQIVQHMNGRIDAENRASGGARFVFEIPLYSVPAPEALPEPEAPETLAGPVRVLIVDDNATNRLVARSLVEMFGCESAEVADGFAALEAVAAGTFDLVLLDINMPGIDGVETARRIRALPGSAAQVPIVALTANAGLADGVLYRSSGMAAVVEKPIRPDRLVAAMNAALATVSKAPAAAA